MITWIFSISGRPSLPSFPTELGERYMPASWQTTGSERERGATMLDHKGVSMKGTEKVVLAWVALLFAISLCVLLSPFIPWSAHRILHSATAAAWAQTAGTVLAMMSGAGAIAWQVRFESRREARRAIESRLDAAEELHDLTREATGQARTLFAMLDQPDYHADALGRLLQQANYEMRWYEINTTFEQINFSAIPGARLKLAFQRAKNGFTAAFVAHGEIFQHLHNANATRRPSHHSLARAVLHLEHAELQIGAIGEALRQDVARV